MKTHNQRDLEKHWADQSKKLTPAERLAMKAEKLRKQIERDKAILERRKNEQTTPQPVGQGTASATPEGKPAKSRSAESPRRRARE